MTGPNINRFCRWLYSKEGVRVVHSVMKVYRILPPRTYNESMFCSSIILQYNDCVIEDYRFTYTLTYIHRGIIGRRIAKHNKFSDHLKRIEELDQP